MLPILCMFEKCTWPKELQNPTVLNKAASKYIFFKYKSFSAPEVRHDEELPRDVVENVGEKIAHRRDLKMKSLEFTECV